MFDAAPTSQAMYAGSMNLAPSYPLLNASEPEAKEHSSLCEMLREHYQDIIKQNVNERREMNESGKLMANLRSGKLIMKRDPIKGGLALLKPLPTTTRKDRHVYPLAQVNSSQLTSIWTLSRPKAVPRHFGDTNKAQIQHSLLQRIIEHYDVEWFDEVFHQRESLAMMDYGTTVIRVSYDDRLNRITQIRPVIEEREQEVFEGYAFCPHCKFEGKPSDVVMDPMPRCPDCGSYDMPNPVDGLTAMVPEIIGSEEIHQGDIKMELLPFPALSWDYRFLPQDSDYLLYRQEVSRRFIESLVGVGVAEQDSSDDEGLRIINELGTRGGSTAGWGRENLYGNAEYRGGTTILDEMYLSPERYAGERLIKDEKTVTGEVLEAGTYLTDIFPDGICAVGVDEMNTVVGVYAEKRRVVGSVYHIQSESGVGKGTQDAVEVSEHLNIAHSGALAQLKRIGAGGGIWYDKDVMSQSEALELMKPGRAVGISMRGTQYNSVDSALRQIRHQEINHSNLAMIAQLSNILNIAFQTTDFTQGVADNRVDVNTATGQQMLLAQNQQRSAAPLRLKGWSRARIFEHVIELFREHKQIPEFFSSRDKFSLTRGRYISGADLPKSVKCDFVADSEQPTNTFTKRQNTEQMLEKSQYWGVPFAELAMSQPRLATWYAGQFQTEIPLFNEEEILMVCQNRLDSLKEVVAEMEQLLELTGMQPDPSMLEEVLAQVRPSLSPAEENLIVKAQVLGEYLDDDEVEEWSPVLKQAFEAMLWRHHELSTQFQYAQKGLQMQGELGLQQMQMQAQAAAMAPQMEAQAQAQAAAEEDAMLGEGLTRAADMISAEEDHQRTLEQGEADFARQRRLQSEGHVQALELEKQKAKAMARNRNTQKAGQK